AGRGTVTGRLPPPASDRAPARRRAFFFQAEDGIRGGHVTGVQTCALPILNARPISGCTPSNRSRSPDALVPSTRVLSVPKVAIRSEERRVGKECRAGG